MSDEILDEGIVSKPAQKVNIGADAAIYEFANTNPEELGTRVQDFLIGQGYKLEQGNATSAVYGKGSKTMRVLFGAFVKRFTWGVKIASDGDVTKLKFSKDEKGYWGGVIGVNQVKNEYKKITSALERFHTKHHDTES